MARYAIVSNGKVETISEWDGVTPWQPPAGTTAIPCPDNVSAGYTYDGANWTPPSAPGGGGGGGGASQTLAGGAGGAGARGEVVVITWG